jgi:spermidine/putrescine-binding protein
MPARPPTSPAANALTLSRRRLLGLGGAALSLPWLAACATDPEGVEFEHSPDPSESEPTLAVSNWSQYIDTELKDRSAHPTVMAAGTIYRGLSSDDEQRYSAAFAEVRGV